MGSKRKEGKPDDIGKSKHRGKDGDRHNIPNPGQDDAEAANDWARVLTTKRCADLFKTAQGLPGHVQQIQQEVSRASRAGTFDSPHGKKVAQYIGNSIESAAKSARFDFAEFEIKFPNKMGYLKISKSGKKVNVRSRP